MNLHKMPWLIVLAALYIVFLATFIFVASQNDWTSMFAIGVMLVVVGNLMGALIIYGLLFDIHERIKSSKMSVTFYNSKVENRG